MKTYQPIDTSKIDKKKIEKYLSFLNELGEDSIGKLEKKYNIPFVCGSLLEDLGYIKKTVNGGYSTTFKQFEPIHARQLLLSLKEYYLNRDTKKPSGVKVSDVNDNSINESIFILNVYERIKTKHVGMWNRLGVTENEPKPSDLFLVIDELIDVVKEDVDVYYFNECYNLIKEISNAIGIKKQDMHRNHDAFEKSKTQLITMIEEYYKRYKSIEQIINNKKFTS